MCVGQTEELSFTKEREHSERGRDSEEKALAD